MSQSTGGKNSRITTTTNLNTGERKSYVTQRGADGWITRTSLSGTKSKPVKFKKTKIIKLKKSKPLALGTTGWIILGIILILLLASN
jgi:hypothetical protein